MVFEHDEKEGELFKVGLYPLCEGLRMQASGASDPWKDDYEEEVVRYLCKRLQHWIDSPMGWSAFDDAVKRLIRAALLEWLCYKQRKLPEWLDDQVMLSAGLHPNMLIGLRLRSKAVGETT